MSNCSPINNSNPNCLNNNFQNESDVKDPIAVSPNPKQDFNSRKTLPTYQHRLSANRFGAPRTTVTDEPNAVRDLWRTYVDDVKVLWNGGTWGDKAWASGYAAFFGIGTAIATIPVGYLTLFGCGRTYLERDAKTSDGGPDSSSQDQGVVSDVVKKDVARMDQVIPEDSQILDKGGDDPQMDRTVDLPTVCSSTSFVLEKISDPAVRGKANAIGCANINGPGDHIAWSPLSVDSSQTSPGLFLYSRATHRSKKIGLDETDGKCSLDDSGNKVAFNVNTGVSPSSGTEYVIKLYDDLAQSTQTYWYTESGNENTAPQLTSDGTILAYHNFYFDSITDSSGMRNIVIQNLVAGSTKVVSAESFGQTFLNINGNFLIYQEPASGNLFHYDLAADTTQPLGATPTGAVFSANDAGDLVAFSNGANQPGGTPSQILLLDTSNNQVQPLEEVDGQLISGPFISRNGRCVVWHSGDINDPNANNKILVRDLSRGETQVVNINANGDLTNRPVKFRDLDANCENLLYLTAATNLTDGCGNLLNNEEVENLYNVGLNYFFSSNP